MKKFFAVFIIIFLFDFKIFSDCYFSFDGPSIVTLQDWSGNTESAYFASAIAGFSFPFYRKDNFQEYKTSYYLATFAETQFTGRWRSKENSTNTKLNKSDTEINNDFYLSAGLDIFQIFRPKISYGFLTKDVYASIFLGVPLPLLGAKFLSNSDNIGFQACFGFEPIWNITSSDSLSKPFYFNYRANFKIYLDFSRKKRYANYIENQRRIQIQREENERRIRAEQKMQLIQKQKEAEEMKAKELGFSSVEDYYADLKKKEEEKQKLRIYYRNNYTIYGNCAFPLLFGKSAEVINLKASNPNFVKNIPFGFANDVYYNISSDAGEVLQWIDRETCLFKLKEVEHSYYGYSVGKIYSGLAYVHFDSRVTSYPFDKNGVLYIYTGVYNYITAIGATNTIPKFEAVFYIDKVP